MSGSREVQQDQNTDMPTTTFLWNGMVCPMLKDIYGGSSKRCYEFWTPMCFPCVCVAQFACAAIPVAVGAACSAVTFSIDCLYNVAKCCAASLSSVAGMFGSCGRKTVDAESKTLEPSSPSSLSSIRIHQ